MEKNKKFLLSAAGIFISFFFFGLIQEKITKAEYVNPDGSVENFSYSTSLVFVYCGMNYVFSQILLSFIKQEDTTRTIYYSISGMIYFLAMVCSNLALQFISYPTQVIAKSCKPIPVMIFGVLLGKKSYSFRKYIFIGMVVLGVIMFMYKDKKEKDGEKSNSFEGVGLGELLVLSSLFMDGLYAAVQERMRSEHHTKPLPMMAKINKWASIYLGLLWIATREIFTFTAFVQRQPLLLWKLAALSVCGFAGQFSMIVTVTEFGTLPASVVATIRKFFTVLVSVLLLGNHLLTRQWIATVIIFAGLFLDILYGKREGKTVKNVIKK